MVITAHVVTLIQFFLQRNQLIPILNDQQPTKSNKSTFPIHKSTNPQIRPNEKKNQQTLASINQQHPQSDSNR